MHHKTLSEPSEDREEQNEGYRKAGILASRMYSYLRARTLIIGVIVIREGWTGEGRRKDEERGGVEGERRGRDCNAETMFGKVP